MDSKVVIPVELKYKVNKIRDLVVFETGIVPIEVDVARHEVVVSFRRSDFVRRGLELEKVRSVLEDVVARKVRIEVLD